MRILNYLIIFLILSLSSLSYAGPMSSGPISGSGGGGGTGVTDGDKGDVTVSGTGTVWDVDNDSHSHTSATIDAAITRDTEWDTLAEINAATTDADALATNGSADDLSGVSSGAQPLDNELTQLAAGYLALFSNPLPAAPGSPVDGYIYCANNEVAGWDPCTISGTVDYLVMYDGANYIALVDKDGNWFVKEFQINGTDDGIADSTFNGISMTGTAGDTLAIGDFIYLSDTDGRWELADANSTTVRANLCEGIAISAAANDGDAVVIGLKGKLRLDTWTWTDTEGNRLYLSETAGDATETRYTSASSAVQVIGYILSDDEIFFDPELHIDRSITRIGTDADGRTLTCLEASNTWWEATGAGTIKLPSIATCPTINVTVTETGAVAVVLDPDDGDDSIVDGVAKGDGVAWTSISTAGDMIVCAVYDTDTIICQSNSWTAP